MFLWVIHGGWDKHFVRRFECEIKLQVMLGDTDGGAYDYQQREQKYI